MHALSSCTVTCDILRHLSECWKSDRISQTALILWEQLFEPGKEVLQSVWAFTCLFVFVIVCSQLNLSSPESPDCFLSRLLSYYHRYLLRFSSSDCALWLTCFAVASAGRSACNAERCELCWLTCRQLALVTGLTAGTYSFLASGGNLCPQFTALYICHN